MTSGDGQELDGQSRKTSCLHLPFSWLVKESTGACCRCGPSMMSGEKAGREWLQEPPKFLALLLMTA